VKVVVVSSYPPRHCGIGAYAAAQVERLRQEGHRVTVISPEDGNGDVRVRFDGGRPFRAAERIGGDADRIVVHFQPSLYYRPRAPLSKIATSWALLRLARRRRRTEILVHEADPPIRWRPDYVLLGRAFRDAPVLLFHTERERESLERTYRIRVRSRIVPHTQGVLVRRHLSRMEARRRLDLPPDQRVLLTPGFLHPDKGIERAMEAVRGLGGARLYVVGSVKDRTPGNLRYAARIRDLAGEIDQAELVERFPSDEEFDAWIAAADVVVLPYRRSWSSGALARAQAIGVPANVTTVGGLTEQASSRDVVVDNDEGLRAAVTRVVAPAPGGRIAQ
jgi:glycosyltransferase involved in cell wall biosynthesis